MDFSEHKQNLPLSDRLQHMAMTASADDLKMQAAQLSPAEISNLISILATQKSQPHELHPYDKCIALILGLDDAVKLQAAGKSLTPLLANRLFEEASQKDEALMKCLPPLLVGMSPSLFANALLLANDQQLAVLKKEAPTEAIQHLLALVAQELNCALEVSQKELEFLYCHIQELPLDSLDKEQLDDIEHETKQLFNKTLPPQQILNKALAIAWNTSRTDLISKLSSLKERYHRHALHFAEPSANNSLNVHKALKDKLSSVFAQNSDDDAAIDALANLSIWYIKDYWEIGLLPHIHHIDEGLTRENAATTNNGNLFETAKINLEKIGLRTLKDLKNAHIYSKTTLKDFIAAKQSLLQS